jgi:hypothetical protein
MNKAEKEHLSKVASVGCIVCRMQGNEESPAEIHHIRHGQGMSQRASNYEVIPLCPFIIGWVDMATPSIPAAKRGNRNSGKS